MCLPVCGEVRCGGDDLPAHARIDDAAALHIEHGHARSASLPVIARFRWRARQLCAAQTHGGAGCDGQVHAGAGARRVVRAGAGAQLRQRRHRYDHVLGPFERCSRPAHRSCGLGGGTRGRLPRRYIGDGAGACRVCTHPGRRAHQQRPADGQRRSSRSCRRCSRCCAAGCCAAVPWAAASPMHASMHAHSRSWAHALHTRCLWMICSSTCAAHARPAWKRTLCVMHADCAGC